MLSFELKIRLLKIIFHFILRVLSEIRDLREKLMRTADTG